MLECDLTNTIQMPDSNVWNRISSNHTYTSYNFSIKIIQMRKCLLHIQRIVFIWQLFITFAWFIEILVFGIWNIILHTCHILASYLAAANFMPSFFPFFFLSVRGLRLFCLCVIFTICVVLSVCKSSHIYFICTVRAKRVLHFASAQMQICREMI